MSNLLNNVLAPTNNLCFNYHEFTKDSFSVDQFLQEHHNMANLETMRDDLGIYLKTLRSAMIELINKDYADFVNLSTNLIGLDKAISNIQLPLGQLKEELIMVQNNIEDALTEVSTQLLRRKKIQERKQSLKSLNRVQCSLKKLNLLLIEVATKADKESKLLQLERAGMEFSQLQFHASQCGGDLSSSHKQSLEDIGKRLYDEVNIQFVECLNNKKDNHLVRTLEIYLTLDKCSQAEESFRKTKVAPVMKQLISEEALAGNPKGLGGLYDSLIEFIDKEMKVLQKVTQSSDRFSSVKGFDFVVNSYWPEVEERLEMHLPSIYAPGNPDNFFVSYSETLQFIEKLESKCNNKPLHEHPQYQSFMHRWNLPVYFQIRFQEIAGGVEGALMSFETSYSSADWKLIATKTVWESLLRCWADKVFITQLTHRFWKLNLQILARYHSWSNELVEKKTEDVQLEVWVCLYSDLVMLSDRLEELFTHIKHRLHSKISQNLLNDLKKCIEEWKLNLVSQLSTVSARLVKSVSAESLAALRQVSEVPRLYRRTNREAPTRSLPYIDVMLKAPLAFHLSHKDHSHTTVWIQSIFSEITKQYYIAVMDVLTSVQKTDDSLRRLKKIRDRSMASGSIPDRGGDGDKIRMQLYFDANYYCKKIEDIGVRKDSVEQLNDLLKLVETLQVKMGLNNP